MLIEYKIYVDSSMTTMLGILRWPIGSRKHTHTHVVKGLHNYLRDYSLGSGHHLDLTSGCRYARKSKGAGGPRAAADYQGFNNINS